MKPPSPATAWSLVGHHATRLHGGLAETLDLDELRTGLAVVRPGATAADHLLGIDLDAESRCVDAWCRGGDLTAVHETLDDPALFIDVCHFTPGGIERLAEAFVPAVADLVEDTAAFREWRHPGRLTAGRGPG